MNDVDAYILKAVKLKIWGGFDTPEDVQEMISDLLEDGADEEMLRKSVDPEFKKKFEAEKSWPRVTDFDRLDEVFTTLKSKGILCLHNAGYTMSDGHYDANEALADYPEGQFYGYCFYHGQDLERAVSGEGLMLAYDHVEGDVPDKLKVASSIKVELERAGFGLEWNGTADQRITIPDFDWKHRSRIMNTESHYTDQLISITDKDIFFYNYYFPSGKKKQVRIADIECITVLEPTLKNGKWRIHGTGNFKVWFPKDKHRPRRDRIFIASLKNQWVNIGFTVENGDTVERIFRSMDLIREES